MDHGDSAIMVSCGSAAQCQREGAAVGQESARVRFGPNFEARLAVKSSIGRRITAARR